MIGKRAKTFGNSKVLWVVCAKEGDSEEGRGVNKLKASILGLALG